MDIARASSKGLVATETHLGILGIFIWLNWFIPQAQRRTTRVQGGYLQTQHQDTLQSQTGKRSAPISTVRIRRNILSPVAPLPVPLGQRKSCCRRAKGAARKPNKNHTSSGPPVQDAF